MDRIPPGSQRVIRDNNLQFLRNRAIYDTDYFCPEPCVLQCVFHTEQLLRFLCRHQPATSLPVSIQQLLPNQKETLDIVCCKHLFTKSAVRRIVMFLLGPHTAQNEEDVQTRRWTSLQTKEFTYLHTMLAVMILYCDVSKFRTIDQGDYPPRQRTLIIPTSKPLAMPSDMQQILFATEGIKYIREHL
ncbi:uncharacterized protein LOC119742812 [Patiria miniata]|uniref:Uncharacterized protein n=1 Tax=Patiria miniata TaxID=46514 RepID=A0A914BG90_PATMI|nr:uncharacterized protein LOC119742812 [Patiria miniata]